MTEELVKLYNTLNLIETKGESTKIMGECLTYTERLIRECSENEKKENVKPTENADIPWEEA